MVLVIAITVNARSVTQRKHHRNGGTAGVVRHAGHFGVRCSTR
ncbi:hypothetical protein [Goodfellowiella coeruleoviolacea]|nr:hypothetical protein [Goodfellowiella coeruleoviolacea]